ncbi:hypothetical protein ACE7GA_11135 [Roseomonas sp. CCTCC AB2023176]|uniref:hypothetical protein n=1 Tax=Roseomonas sp. CCTCC AB2023176 TaxID=3342640 RepID=UPI0035D60ECF
MIISAIGYYTFRDFDTGKFSLTSVGKKLMQWGDVATTPNPVVVGNVYDMANKVLATLGEKTMTTFIVLDHGSEQHVRIGRSVLTPSTMPALTPDLARLAGHFAENARLIFMNCHAGRNVDVLKAIAALWGRKLYGGRGTTYNVGGMAYNAESWTGFSPDGTVEENANPGAIWW